LGKKTYKHINEHSMSIIFKIIDKITAWAWASTDHTFQVQLKLCLTNKKK